MSRRCLCTTALLVYNTIARKAIISKGGWQVVKRGWHCNFIENSVPLKRPTIPTPPEDQVEEDEAEPATKEPEVIKIKEKRWTSKSKQVHPVAKRVRKVKNRRERLQAARELFVT